MRYNPFGPTGRQVSVIGMGTWHLDEADRASAVAALRRGLDLGVNHIDTAEMYGSGAAEELVGEAIAGRREDVFLVSKVLPYNASRSGTRLACERSLARLRTDRLDCYLLHWRGQHPLAETVAAFEALRREGKILSWGVSNFDAGDLEEVSGIADRGGPVCDQVLYNFSERSIEHRVMPWCEPRGVAVTGYTPFTQGRFPGPQTAGGRVLAEIAEAHGATPRQVVLAFLVRHPVLFAIPKASTPPHVEENAGAGDLVLSAAEIARIDAAFPRGARRGGLPML